MAHSHEHHHDHHGHHHGHASKLTSLNGIFVFSIVLNLLYVIIEALVGFWQNSLSLLSDAGHNLSDVFSLLLVLIAFQLAKVHANKQYTYGYKKSTVLISLVNAILLLVAIGGDQRSSRIVDGWCRNPHQRPDSRTADEGPEERHERTRRFPPHGGRYVGISRGGHFRYHHLFHRLVCHRSHREHHHCHRHPDLHVGVAHGQPAPAGGRYP